MGGMDFNHLCISNNNFIISFDLLDSYAIGTINIEITQWFERFLK